MVSVDAILIMRLLCSYAWVNLQISPPWGYCLGRTESKSEGCHFIASWSILVIEQLNCVLSLMAKMCSFTFNISRCVIMGQIA